MHTEREMKEKHVSDQLYFPRTRMSYEVQRKRNYINDLHVQNQDLDEGVQQAYSSQQQFLNFLRDHQAWEFRKKKKIEEKVEEKENKILSELTFTPQINETSLKLVPKSIERVENRLLRKGVESEEKMNHIRSARVLPFRPNIYGRNQSRPSSACQKTRNTHTSANKTNSDIPPLPPRRGSGPRKVKLHYNNQDKILANELSNEVHKIREFAPVLDTKNREYNTSPIEHL